MPGKFKAKPCEFKGHKFQSRFEMEVYKNHFPHLTRLKPQMRMYSVTKTTTKYHTPDFRTPNGLNIETKGAITDDYRKQIEALVENQGDSFRQSYAILFQNGLVQAGKLRLTAVQWAQKLGLRYAVGSEIPTEWFNLTPEHSPPMYPTFLAYPVARSGNPELILNGFQALRNHVQLVGDGALIRACQTFNAMGMTHFDADTLRGYYHKNKHLPILHQLIEARARWGVQQAINKNIKHPIANFPIYMHTGQPMEELLYCIGNKTSPYGAVLDLDGSLIQRIVDDATFGELFECLKLIYIPLPPRHYNTEYLRLVFDALPKILVLHQRHSTVEQMRYGMKRDNKEVANTAFDLLLVKTLVMENKTKHFVNPINTSVATILIQQMIDNGITPTLKLKENDDVAYTVPNNTKRWSFHDE